MNGILAEVQGQYISFGMQALPDPEHAEKREHAVELDAGHVGRVVVYYEPRTAKRGRMHSFFWTACRAERVSTDSTP